jgi:hypothetical protein
MPDRPDYKLTNRTQAHSEAGEKRKPSRVIFQCVINTVELLAKYRKGAE